MIKLKISSLALAALLLVATSPYAAAAAGKAVYVFGQARAIGADGTVRTLTRGAEVNAGDTLITLDGRVQVRFSDGGFVALQPNTRFKIDDYKYDGKADGTERSFFNFLKGGIRFVTGVIGHRHKDSYKIRTAVATIGIRGSAGRANMCVGGSCAGQKDGLYLTGEQDVLTLTNRTGPHDVYPGDTKYTECETCRVESLEVGPEAHVEVEKKEEVPQYVEGEQRSSDGVADVVAPALTQATEGRGVFVFSDLTTTSTPPDAFGASTNGSVVGAPPTTVNNGDGSSESFVGDVADYQVFSDGSFIFRWTNGTATFKDSSGAVTRTVMLGPNAGYHFVGGPGPTDPLPTTGMAYYDFVAGTHSTQPGNSTSSSAPGTILGNGITGGEMYVDFLGLTVGGSFDVSHGSTYVVNASSIPLASDGTFNSFAGGTVYATGGTGTCSSSCGADILGGLEGPANPSLGNAPTGLGLGYQIHEGTNGTQHIHGVGYFQAGSFVP